MKLQGPIVTLGAGVLVAAVLMVMNLNVTKPDATADEGALTGATPAPTASATAVSPTATPTKKPDTPAAPATFAGKVRDGGATLAIAITEGKAVAYLCDGKATEAWLQGTASNGELDLRGAAGASLTGTFANGVATGTVSAGDVRSAFSLKTVTAPSGLYRATADVRNARVVGGWIVLPDGQQVGLLTVAGSPRPAPPLDLSSNTVTVDGAPIMVGSVDGTGL